MYHLTLGEKDNGYLILTLTALKKNGCIIFWDEDDGVGHGGDSNASSTVLMIRN